jgi:Family of unknown function (DUF6011)
MDTSVFTSAKDALNFIISGKAIFTISSLKTGKRFTYKVEKPNNLSDKNDDGFRFIKILNGPDNTSNYRYIGYISKRRYVHGRNSKINESAESVVAFKWMLHWLNNDNIMQDKLEIRHEGRCGRCGRMLTVPESIDIGIGPECIKKRYMCE